MEHAFIHNLIEAYTFKPTTTVNEVTIELEKALYRKDIDAIEEQLNVLFSDISHHVFPFQKKQKENPDLEREKKGIYRLGRLFFIPSFILSYNTLAFILNVKFLNTSADWMLL